MNKTVLSLLASLTVAHADPQLTSWFTANSGKYARIYQLTANETAGTPSTTWARGTGTQSNPTYADVSEVNYSASWVYIRTTGLASYVMGPWYLDAAKTTNFPNFPSNTATVYRIPRTPTIPVSKTGTGLGATGRMVNGVSMFDSRDAFSYVNASAQDATPMNGLTGDGVWNRDGWHNEGVTFDPSLAHQAGNNYHYHAQPIGLRYQLGDHVDFNATTNRYSESTTPVTTHSPIVAWAADGLPVYGPYGYSTPMNAASGVRRMVSGFTLRDGTNGTTAITTRVSLPAWAARIQTVAFKSGPAISATYLLGHYIEDFDFRGDFGQTFGVDFDLNEQNVRFCVTPEFPAGTWAYFTPLNADGTPQFPYTTGRQFYGNPAGGASTAAEMTGDTPLTQQFLGGPSKLLAVPMTPTVAGNQVTITWSAVEGGTYSVEASPTQAIWTPKVTGLVSTGISANSTYTALSSSGTEYGRVNRTALATYDTNGFTAATVSQTSPAASYILTPNAAPIITSIATAPALPSSTDSVFVTANIAPPAGRTISNAQLTYNTGSGNSTVFNETMGTAAVTGWTGAGTVYPWTITFTGPPSSPFAQTTAANHTTLGQGNPYGMEITANAPAIANSTVTTTNPINASGTSGTVSFWILSSGLTSPQGWDFQTSTDGATYTTRSSELTGSNHAYQQFSYTLSTSERVSTLKLRFRFAGPGMSAVPKVSLDDISVVIGGASAPVTVTMFDDGAHGDGAAGDGVYGVSIPAQANNTIVSYAITATDSVAASTTSASSSYTVSAAAPVLAVTPATGLTSSGITGGTFTPSSATYTLTNSGNASMNWTATKTAAWLTLTSSGGTLAAGATTTVTATINTAANSLAAATYSETLTFTNSTSGTGNTTRAVNLAVSTNTIPAAPTFTALPSYSQGGSKTVSWAAVFGATGYTLQIATDAGFTSNIASQTVTSPTGSFADLTSGVTYFYRVLATNNIGSSVYSNVVSSTQDSVAPIVAITSPSSALSQATTTITVSGTSSDTISGISKITVNGATATTANGFANWSISVPLGYGTNGITAVAYDIAGNVTTTSPVNVTLTAAQTYNPLIIPEVMSGTTFNLNLHQTAKRFGNAVFQNTADTTTYSYNNMLFWGPTLIMNKGDWVQMNVSNNISATTTTHWHGFHIPAIMDGGPHQTIPAGTTWHPTFKVDNNAGTYWYHPHLHEYTQDQLTHGGGGMIIIRDPIEAALNLPRTYGVDDIPLALTSRRFANNQFITGVAGVTTSAYGDYMVVNGTLSPQVTLPKQYVRLRILNAEIERSYNLGFSDGRTFYQISTDGGLVNAPVALTRVVLGVGERTEILVDLTGATVGSTFDLQSFNSGQSNDYPGGEAAQTGQFGSLLNGKTFDVLRINVGAATGNAVITRPATLTTNTFYGLSDVTNTRTVSITGGIPNSSTLLFSFDNLGYSPSVINQNLNLNAVERWNITNTSGFSHSFHIHDIQFHLISRTGGNNTGIHAYEEGWKDVLFIGQNQTVSFIAKFDGFASDTNPFMYHCHFSNHEDEGLMGQFVVKNNAIEDLAVSSFTRNGSSGLIQLDFKATPGTTYTLQYLTDLTAGSWSDIGSVTSDGATATFTDTDVVRLSQPRGFYRVTIPKIP